MGLPRIAAMIVLCCTSLVSCGSCGREPVAGDQTKADVSLRQVEVPSDPHTRELKARLDSYLAGEVEKLGIPGLTVSVVRDGSVVYTGAFGVRKLGDRSKLTPRHVFHFASVSKTFAATAIMQLVEDGKVNLDDRITKTLPYFRLADARSTEITIRQILNHTSGMPDVVDYQWDHPQFDEGAAERYVRSMASERLLWEPGSAWRYSNMAFDALADVIAKASGRSFEAYVRSKILEPLGMVDSSFIYPEIATALRTTGHVGKVARVSNVYPYNRRHAPSSTLNSNVIDMTSWMLANLNRGELNGRQILRATSYDLLWAPTTKAAGNAYVGLSWFIRDHAGHRTVYHAGGDTGFRAYVLLAPDDGIGIALASNWEETPRETLVEKTLDMLLASDGRRPRIEAAR
jgi:CubicO group peptidase (beta-lactamase class C family)